MQLAMIGLGRMGANMVRRLIGGGHQCVVFDMSPKAVEALAREKAVGASSLADLVRKFYENAKTITGDGPDIDRITNHVLGDACTPGNAKECTFETVRPVVDHCMNGDLDDLLT